MTRGGSGVKEEFGVEIGKFPKLYLPKNYLSMELLWQTCLLSYYLPQFVSFECVRRIRISKVLK